MTDIIQLENLSFSYGKKEVLDQVNSTFQRNKLSVILGRNGSGKSTLFSILSGMQSDYKGSISIDGQLRQPKRSLKDETVRLGFLPQFHQATFPFLVQDLVLTGRSAFFNFKPHQEDLHIVEQVLKRFELWQYHDKPYTQLSGGERQLVLLCRVLVQKPNILILDEPTNHLDLYHQVIVLNNIKALVAENTTVLCVMHDPNMAMQYGDEVFVMHNKKLTSTQGFSPEQIQSLLEQTYNLNLETRIVNGKMNFTPQI